MRTPIVTFDDVSKSFTTKRGETTGVDHLTLSIDRAEIFALIGESGAGKTTVLNLINGMLTPTTGRVTVAGLHVPDLRGDQLRMLRRRIGVMFQGVHLLENRTVRANVALTLQLARRAARDAPWSAEAPPSRRAERDTVDEMLAFVGLADRADHFPAQLSGGQRQRAGLARALVGRPELLLCDEPTSSLDVSTTAEVLRVIADARDAFGTTVVMVTHDLDVVRAICDRAALLERGRLVDVIPVTRSGYRSLPTYREQVQQELKK